VNLGALYNAGPKIWPPKKFGGQKHAKISVYLIKPPTLTVNISETAQDIQNRKANVSRAILPAFCEKGLVNFGPLITEIYTVSQKRKPPNFGQ